MSKPFAVGRVLMTDSRDGIPEPEPHESLYVAGLGHADVGQVLQVVRLGGRGGAGFATVERRNAFGGLVCTAGILVVCAVLIAGVLHVRAVWRRPVGGSHGGVGAAR